MVKKIFLHLMPKISIKNGKFFEEIEIREVELMAEKKGYCMVRIKGCMPYVARKKEILIK